MQLSSESRPQSPLKVWFFQRTRQWTKGFGQTLVVELEDELFIVDSTVPFENRKGAFSQARKRKVEKYKPLIDYFHSIGRQKASIVPIVVGSLGAWDPENDAFLRKFTTKSYLNLLRKLCVSVNIRWSRDIFIQHLTGIQQYRSSTVVPNPIVGVEETPTTCGDQDPPGNSPASPHTMSSQSESLAYDYSQNSTLCLPLTQGEGNEDSSL
ncbi:retrovirus-related Pol polyprotein from type-1 retrotransposable element R2 [Trichonephila clavata]|uniref:Retrovirus-related Pol polyprotein from type-1 retrotransposable element R2 n=1 Tax=Trichonephila clavata TaxID=2740835 RepID=A0A8X6G617_TRICU|nr:retrovirus-related Pol polyprotein from type-1 retrotransposable element R2 [Trichonephila clavata]